MSSWSGKFSYGGRVNRPAMRSTSHGGQRRVAALEVRPLGFDLVAERLGPALLHQEFDARFVNVVAPAVAVVHAQHRIEIREQVPPGQELAHDVPDDGRAAEPAADDHAEADFPVGVADRVQADVVHPGRRAVVRRAVDRDLELARQVLELGVQRRPLPDDLAPRERVDDLVGRDPGEMIGGDVAHDVAARLDRVHLHRRELGEDLGDVLELRPVELQVLACREVAIPAVVGARDVRELVQLRGGQQPVGDRDAQHRRVPLDVQAVPEPQRPELVLRQLARQEAAGLIAELADPVVYQALIDLVVAVHRGSFDPSLRTCSRRVVDWRYDPKRTNRYF